MISTILLSSTLLGSPPLPFPARRPAGGAPPGGVPAILVSTPMPPPSWALLERELLRQSALACREYFEHYFDDRGYLLCVERWGGDDGPDDAAECVAHWPLLHALGAGDEVLLLYKKAWEGHLRQYTEARTRDVPFARDGMYYREFHVMFDWLHLGEGLTAFNLQGLSDPLDVRFRHRVRRYAGFYLGADPQTPNYDPQHRIIRSLFTGSRGPLLRRATALDWAGDPIEVEGRFELRHGERSYEEMLAHFEDYTEILGDHPQNLAATTLALNAYMLTGERKYRDWVLEYAGAWLDRMGHNGGIIPTNVGPDGKIGSAAGGKWYGGVYGWGFTVRVPQTGELAHRNTHHLGLTGFGNALLLTGDLRYAKAWGRMIDTINSQGRVIDGVKQYPSMYGDQGWYAYTPGPYSHGALEVWYWTQDPEDRKRLAASGWVAFLEGRDPSYPAASLERDLETLRARVEGMRRDPTTADTRLADDPLRYNPAAVRALVELMLGGFDPGQRGAPLHALLRYFDPEGRRAGPPPDVAALVSGMSAESVTVTLVNTSQLFPRTVLLQAGTYGEHQFLSVAAGKSRVEIGAPLLRVRLEPGAGTRLEFALRRYAHQPRLAFPWDRGWMAPPAGPSAR